jgi:hypothetical protein
MDMVALALEALLGNIEIVDDVTFEKVVEAVIIEATRRDVERSWREVHHG